MNDFKTLVPQFWERPGGDLVAKRLPSRPRTPQPRVFMDKIKVLRKRVYIDDRVMAAVGCCVRWTRRSRRR